MGGQVEQGMLNVEVFLPFKIHYSTLDIQNSIPLRPALSPQTLNPYQRST